MLEKVPPSLKMHGTNNLKTRTTKPHLMMRSKWNRQLATALLTFATIVCGGATKRCEICGHAVPLSYLVYKGKTCCSEECVNALRPRCSVCGKTVSGEYLTANSAVYCSKSCIDTTLPKCDLCATPVESGYAIAGHTYCATCKEHYPRCFSCDLPAAHTTRLNDGREICPLCMRWAVKDATSAQRQYARALHQLEAWTALKLDSVPRLVLVYCQTMRNLSQQIRKTESPVSVRGLYSRQITTTTIVRLGLIKEETTDIDEQIYIVDHLHDSVFRVAAIHELMHDVIQEHFPRVKDAPLWVEEGICQQAAAEYCRLRHYSDILFGIENCTDPDYGNGYRYIKQQVGVGGWPALKRWMENIDIAKLPETAPANH